MHPSIDPGTLGGSNGEVEEKDPNDIPGSALIVGTMQQLFWRSSHLGRTWSPVNLLVF